MPDNVKNALSQSLRRLLRPLVRIMLREGLTYPQFAAIAQLAYVESAVRDFPGKGARTSAGSVRALTGLSAKEISEALDHQERLNAGSDAVDNPFERVLHGWHNDRDYVGPYGFPIDLHFDGEAQSFKRLAARHAPGVSPEAILQELRRIGSVVEVGDNIWKPLKQEYIDPSLSPINLVRMATLVESLIATLENNTSANRDTTDLFERTMTVTTALSKEQLLALQAYMKVVGGQFLHRVDAYAAIDLQETNADKPVVNANIRAGLECFLFVESTPDDTGLRNLIDFNGTTH